MKMEAESGTREPQAEDAWSPKELLPTSLQRDQALPTPGFQTSGLQTIRKQTPGILSHLVCGGLLQQPQETNTANSERIRHEHPQSLKRASPRCCLNGTVRAAGKEPMCL